MDDQEVVREPFEEENIGSSSSSNDDGDADESSFQDKHVEVGDSLRDQYYDDDDSFKTSPVSVEDIKFAENYGVHLKQTKTSIYERLMNSNQFEATKKNKIEPEPIIKTSLTLDCIYHKGNFYQKGDIVAVCDQQDGQVYFAQIIGFLQDQYCEKSASINWLVPTRTTSRKFFDPSAYRIGLEDPQLRKLDCMTFVRHCPHDYYFKKMYKSGVDESVAITSGKGENSSFIWTTMRPSSVPDIEVASESIE